MQKPPATLTDFERNTIWMIHGMRKAGINVFDNDSWNPLSADFLAANHIKLWIFDGRLAFIGGIGIESQFRTLLYDENGLNTRTVCKGIDSDGTSTYRLIRRDTKIAIIDN